MLFLCSWVPNSQKVPRLLTGYPHLPACPTGQAGSRQAE